MVDNIKKTIQVGTSNFKELIEENHYFVDKTLLIKEFIEESAKVILTPRPRRFGKTLNMSMIKYFFDIENKEKNRGLFTGLMIEKEEEIMKLQGKYPVIFITFKNHKHFNFSNMEEGIKILFSELYREYAFLLVSDKIQDSDKKLINRFIDKQASTVECLNALSNLMRLLNLYYSKKVIVLIDEYDIPMQEGYIRNYYDEVVTLLRNIMTAALKDNDYLEKSLITGILRVAKESLFSGLNNVQVHTMFSYKFNDKFGFTEKEVNDLLNYYNLNHKLLQVKKWYNGYIFGGKTIYNPWSVLNYISNKENGFMPYWINSSGNELIKKLLVKGSEETKANLESLIKGDAIKTIIDDHIVMNEVEEEEENIWSFLTLSGYLKPIKTELIDGELHCDLKIPNNEVLIFYRNLIKKWFSESLTTRKYTEMLNALINGDIEVFEEIFSEFVVDNISYFDVSGVEPEKVYHAFVLGMIVSLNDKYEVKSNKESGYGRYDIMIIPKDKTRLGIIIEFKNIRVKNKKSLDKGTEEALNQIEEMQYDRELKNSGINNILKLAIVFKGKEVRITEG